MGQGAPYWEDTPNAGAQVPLLFTRIRSYMLQLKDVGMPQPRSGQPKKNKIKKQTGCDVIKIGEL